MLQFSFEDANLENIIMIIVFYYRGILYGTVIYLYTYTRVRKYADIFGIVSSYLIMFFRLSILL